MSDINSLLVELPAETREKLLADVTAQVTGKRLVAALETAAEAFRADPSDDNKTAYRAANEALHAHRAEAKAGRAGVSVGGDAVKTGD